MYDNRENHLLVSVVVPVYNAEKYVAEALDSIVNQDYRWKEVIIIDDCSTDNSVEIISEYVKKYDYISFYNMPKNSGVAKVRNKAIEIANGRFIAFLDSDDIWEKGKLTEQLKLFELHKGTPLTYTALYYMDELGRQLKGKRNVKESVSYSFLLKNTMIATSTVIIDREVVSEVVMPDRHSAEDYSLWLSILKKYGVAYGLNEAFTGYRKSQNSLSSNRIGEVKYFYKVQVEDIGLNKIRAGINTLCYIINAVKKHFL